MKVREIVEAIGISHGTVITVLHEKLPMKKPSTWWVPHLLTVENKRNRVTDSMAGLALFHRNPSEFCDGRSLLMNLRSIFTRLRQKNSWNSGQHQANQLRKRWRRMENGEPVLLQWRNYTNCPSNYCRTHRIRRIFLFRPLEKLKTSALVHYASGWISKFIIF